MSRQRNPMIVVGYILGSIMIVVGILILTGVLQLQRELDPSLTTIFGIVIILYGFYRIAIVDTKRRREERDERRAAEQ